MPIPRLHRAAFALLLAATLIFGALPGTTTPRAGAAAIWTAGPTVSGGSAFLLPDSRVALIGGLMAATAAHPDAGEILDLTGSTSRPISPWPARAPLEAPVLLNDGRLFLSGGGYHAAISPGSFTTITDAYSYDPATDRWVAAAFLPAARNNHSAITLRDGTVLVVGGCGGSGIGATACYSGGTTEALRYDPATDRWSGAGQTAFGHISPRLTLLADGRVLATVGTTQGTTDPTPKFGEIFDPATGRWYRTGPTIALREGHTATLLADGRVLVGGGMDTRADRFAPVASAELYDPVADRWTSAAALTTPRQRHTATLLTDRRVLVVGGTTGTTQFASAELYDPATDRWLPAARLATRRAGHAALRLTDGRVLVTGGTTDFTVPATSEIYGEVGPPEACFAATGQCARGVFLAYWQANGGLAINGYPLTGERYEQLEDGRFTLVQYFERARFELHPENSQTPNQVLLGQFGRRLHPADASVASQPGATFFPETGHNVPADFLTYWRANGGLSQFGFPLSEVFRERLENGQEYEVQYFERARFERHPENAPPYDILLGQFGRRILAENDLLGTADGASFGALYIRYDEVRRALGAPSAQAMRAPGATQAFERGRMYYRSDTRRIYIFCGGVTGSVLLTPQGEPAFLDTWEEGQDPGGGPAPQPGLAYPQRGFGKLWRENQRVRDCLGYAHTGNEEAYTFAAQPFQRGLLLAGAPSEGRIVYVVALGPFGNGTGPDATYTPYPEPTR